MKSKKGQETVIVYSSEHGEMCPVCEKPVSQCSCKQKQPSNRGDGIVRVARQTKGRKGKCVTVITGVPLTLDGLHTLAKELKKKCGIGGTVKEGTIEMQGDQRDRLVEGLKKYGYTVKRSGG